MNIRLVILFCLSFVASKASDTGVYFIDYTKYESDSSLAIYLKKKAIESYYSKYASQALIYGLEGLKVNEKLKDSSGIAWSYNLIGTVYSGQKKDKKARVFLKKGYHVSAQMKDTSGMIRAINNLATSYASDNRTDTALLLLNEGLKWSLEISDTDNVARFYYNIGTYYSVLNEYGKTLEYLDSSIYYCKLMKDSFNTAIRYDLYAFILLENKRFEASIAYNNRSLDIYKTEQDTLSVTNIYNKLGRAYLRKGEYKKAENILTENIGRIKSNNTFYLADCYGLLVELFKAKRDFPKALKYLELQKIVEDSTVNEKENSQWATIELIEAYERTKLREEKEYLKLEEKRKSKQLKIYIALLIVVVILTFILLVFLFKLKTSHAKVIKQQINIFEKNQQLKEGIKDKEILLKEIHHRVKNNLQMISSMLGMQEMIVDDEKIKLVLEQAQNRIEAMALIHQQLYQTEQLGYINIREYLDNLIGYVQQVNTQNYPINISLSVSKDVELNIDKIIPIGLIVSEALSNCFKHAFASKLGEINVELLINSENTYLLIVRDDGLGFPLQFNMNQSKSLGMRLIQILSSQIGGEMKYFNDEGAVVEIQFKP